MALVIKKVQTGGVFFKPEDYKDALAFLIEPTAFEHQRPGKFGPKDTVTADISVFATQADLDNGTPTVLKGALINTTILARDLRGHVGAAAVQRLDKVKSNTAGRQDAWVWRDVEDDVLEKVVAYGEKRDAEIEAALANVPSFE